MSNDRSRAPVALVTGAAVRVGKAITEALTHAGYRVWIHHHRSGASAQALAETLPHGLPAVAADLSDAQGRAALVDRVLDPGGPADGRLDLLVNNAASFVRGPLAQTDDATLRGVLELVLVAPLSLTRRALPALRRGPGAVINIGDLLARHPDADVAVHAAAKAGLEAATRALSLELAPIRVNTVVPGTVAWPAGTPQPAREATERRNALGRIADPRDVAEAVLFLARAPAITGQSLVVDAGQSAGTSRRPRGED